MSFDKPHIHQVGDKVWVNDRGTVKCLVVAKQEWWQANKNTPVYYNLQDENGNAVDQDGSGNWHWLSVFLTKEEAKQAPEF